MKLLAPDPVVTGADGWFAVRTIAGGRFRTSLRVSRGGYSPRTGTWTHLAPGSVEEVGRVELKRGVHANGKIVDRRGRPLRGIKLYFTHLPLALTKPAWSKCARHEMANDESWTVTGPGGTFRSREALPPGKHTIRVEGAGASLIQPETVTIPEVEPHRRAIIIVRTPASISGRVVDDLGKPVANVLLMARDAESSGVLSTCRTEADGFFRIVCPTTPREDLRIHVLSAERCEPGEPIKGLKWRQRDLVIRLKRLPTVALTVVEAETGKPVEDFAIRTISARQDGATNQRLRQSGHHADGRLLAEGIAKGRGWLEVVPKDQTLQPTSIGVVGKQGMDPMRVEVRRLVPMKLLVVGPDGKFAANRLVCVIEPGLGKFPVPILRRPRSTWGGAHAPNAIVVLDTLLFETRTDAAGQCVVYGVDGRDDLVLSIGQDLKSSERFAGIAFGAEHLSRKFRLSK